MKHIITTDEAIIKESSRLQNFYGYTEECCNAIKALAKSIAESKCALWKPILDGIVYSIQGDMAHNADKASEHLYKKAIAEFEKANVPEKISPLYVYYTQNKLYAIWASKTEDVDTIILKFDNLINQCSSNTSADVQWQTAQSMLVKSYILGRCDRVQEEYDIERAIQEKYKDSSTMSIQVIVAKSINNQSTSIELLNELHKTDGNKLRIELINKYAATTDEDMQQQITVALKKNIANTIALAQLQQIQQMIGMNDGKSQQQNYQEEAICYCKQLIENPLFKNAKSPAIRENVAIGIYLYINILTRQEKKDGALEQISILTDLCSTLKSDIIKQLLCNALETKADILIEQAKEEHSNTKLELAMEVLSDLISKFKKVKSIDIKRIVANAMSKKASILHKNGNIERSLDVCTELINEYGKDEDEKLQEFVFRALECKGECLMTLSNMSDKDMLLQAINTFTELLDTYKSKEYTGQWTTPVSMMNKGICLSNTRNFEDAISTFQKVIEMYETDEYAESDGIKKIVRDAEMYKCKIKILQPINELIEFYPSNGHNIEALIRDITWKRVIPFIGAGLSKFAGYPLWGDFLGKVYDNNKTLMKNKIEKAYFSRLSCKEQASTLAEELSSNLFKNEVKKFYEDKDISEELLQQQPLWIVPKIFQNQLLMTSNFDHLIERTYGLEKINLLPCTSKDVNRIKTANTTTVLYKVHGSIEWPREVVLTKEDYENLYRKDGAIYKEIESILSNNSMLFLGCSLQEDIEVLEFCNNSNAEHYAIYPCKKEDFAKKVRELGSKGNILPILYPEGKYEYITHILKYIFASIP
jgi:tetratricopeptide (TPR) repeat protein